MAPRSVRLSATLFAVLTFLISWWHWWSFQYGTFDLAFYVQAMWLALRGQWQVSLLNVPLMGNHAEPIVFLLAPVFALWPHPMLFVGVQTLALASMPFTAWRIGRRLALDPQAAALLAISTVLTPATVLIGVYEFHPEALAAPFLLLLIEARLARQFGMFWLWFIATLAVKENMALLLAAWCVVFAVLDRKRGRSEVISWNILPALLAIAWLLAYAKVISPKLNAGNVDYLQLYYHLGGSPVEIVKGAVTAPAKILGALWNALTKGNMVWGLLLPFALLPLYRVRWWLIATPVLLQHLLSWRFTEWSLGAHYPAPFIPLLWVAMAETVGRIHRQRLAAWAVLVACLVGQVWLGPLRGVIAEIPTLAEKIEERHQKARLLGKIPAEASVLASQPFLSHLAGRERIFSLHHVLKGLKTLSTADYQTPDVTDAVVIDYADGSTFSTEAGYYHPRMRVDETRYVESSDRLLHEFLRRQPWAIESRNEVSLFLKGDRLSAFDFTSEKVQIDPVTSLLGIQMAPGDPRKLVFRFAWEFADERKVFPWLMIVLSDGKQLYPFVKGPCAIEAGIGKSYEEWELILPAFLPSTGFEVFALFYDASQAAWQKKFPPGDATYTLKKISLGHRWLSPEGTPEPAR